LAPIPNRFVPGTSVVVHGLGPRPACATPKNGNPIEVIVVDHDFGTIQDLCFNTAATYGSGRLGVWAAPRAAIAGAAPGPGVTYDVFAADSLNFYRYGGNRQWSQPLPVHVDTWWMQFPSPHNGVSECNAYAANDGGIFENLASSCSLTKDAAHGGWVGASSGLHVLFSTGISGVPVRFPNQLFCLDNQGASCSLLFVGSADNDTFIRDPTTHSWTNFPDGVWPENWICMKMRWFGTAALRWR
jgi:hypothetical protein